jgi:acetyltransferase
MMTSTTEPPPLHRQQSSKSSYSHDFWKHFQQRPLDSVFRPRSVALVGASDKDGSVGKTILWNLLTSPFGGTIYPVNNNPRKLKGNIFGIRSYQRMQDLPEEGIDLVIIAVPAKVVKEVSCFFSQLCVLQILLCS